jgi:hypothetical protein
MRSIQRVYLRPHPTLSHFLWTLEWRLRGNVIIRKAQRAIQTGDCHPRRRSSSRFPLLLPGTLSSRGPPLSLVFRTEDVWRRCNHFIETAEFLIRVSPSHSYDAGRAGLGCMSGWFLRNVYAACSDYVMFYFCFQQHRFLTSAASATAPSTLSRSSMYAKVHVARGSSSC